MKCIFKNSVSGLCLSLTTAAVSIAAEPSQNEKMNQRSYVNQVIITPQSVIDLTPFERDEFYKLNGIEDIAPPVFISTKRYTSLEDKGFTNTNIRDGLTGSLRELYEEGMYRRAEKNNQLTEYKKKLETYNQEAEQRKAQIEYEKNKRAEYEQEIAKYNQELELWKANDLYSIYLSEYEQHVENYWTPLLSKAISQDEMRNYAEEERYRLSISINEINGKYSYHYELESKKVFYRPKSHLKYCCVEPRFEDKFHQYYKYVKGVKEHFLFRPKDQQ